MVETDEGRYLVLEHVEGETIASRLRRETFDIPTLIRLGREIGEALGEAHRKGILHRDLKAENVMITPLGHAKILDFGIARKMASGETTDGSAETTEGIEPASTEARTVVGTCRSMSPEQAGGRVIDARSELFSLGVLLFEMATCRSPFQGENRMQTLSNILTLPAPAVEELAPAVPPRLAALIHRLLAKDPAQRPADALSVASELATLEAAQGAISPEMVPAALAQTASADLFGEATTGQLPPAPEAGRDVAPSAVQHDFLAHRAFHRADSGRADGGSLFRHRAPVCSQRMQPAEVEVEFPRRRGVGERLDLRGRLDIQAFVTRRIREHPQLDGMGAARRQDGAGLVVRRTNFQAQLFGRQNGKRFTTIETDATMEDRVIAGLARRRGISHILTFARTLPLACHLEQVLRRATWCRGLQQACERPVGTVGDATGTLGVRVEVEHRRPAVGQWPELAIGQALASNSYHHHKVASVRASPAPSPTPKWVVFTGALLSSVFIWTVAEAQSQATVSADETLKARLAGESGQGRLSLLVQLMTNSMETDQSRELVYGTEALALVEKFPDSARELKILNALCLAAYRREEHETAVRSGDLRLIAGTAERHTNPTAALSEVQNATFHRQV